MAHMCVRTLLIGGAWFVATVLYGQTAGSSQRSKWWVHEDTQRQLGLTSDQVRSLDRIYQSTLPQRRFLRRQLDDLEETVQLMMARGDVDEDTALALISRLETTRAKRNVTRSLMLLQMHRVLSPDQRATLKRLTERLH